jgi:G:T-mismatch repair DNA endonuclease (very short patch repair protein)
MSISIVYAQPIPELEGYIADPSGDVYYGNDKVETVLGEEGYLWIWIDPKTFSRPSYMEPVENDMIGWYRRCDLILNTLSPYPEDQPPVKEDGTVGRWVIDHIDSDKENDTIENLEWTEWTNLDHIKSWEFIKKAWVKHGKGMYEYRDSWYINCRNKISISCKIHKLYYKRPDIHLKGEGCHKCAVQKRIIAQTWDTEKFLQMSEQIHGNRYDYSKSVYKYNTEKVIIICKIHGEFRQAPICHVWMGHGCPKCGLISQVKKRTKPVEQFINEANLTHKGLYDYSAVVYKGKKKNVCIICKIHGEFYQLPGGHIIGQGCPTCGLFSRVEKRTKTLEQFIKEANITHGDLYDYSNSVYKNSKIPMNIICKIHGIFYQAPQDHISGHGCTKCGVVNNSALQAKSIDQFINEANIKHGNLYDYSSSVYKNSKIPMNIICKIHGIFYQAPNNHLQGAGCPRCSSTGHSKIALRWLILIENCKDVIIQHAEKTGGEFKINRYKADGYFELEERRVPIPNTTASFVYPVKKIVFEFQGCFWHGCPKCFQDRKEINGVNKKTMQQLYDRTQVKNKYLRDNGYHVIEIWECNYYERIGPGCSVEAIEEYMNTLKF